MAKADRFRNIAKPLLLLDPLASRSVTSIKKSLAFKHLEQVYEKVLELPSQLRLSP
ncbi:MAG TPA: hypothetical protein VGC19_09955 [Rhodanobacter sp.]